MFCFKRRLLPSRLMLLISMVCMLSVWMFSKSWIRALNRTEFLELYQQVEALDCSSLIKGDPAEQSKAAAIEKRYSRMGYVMTDADFEYLAQNCSSYKRKRNFIPRKVTNEELEFPIAYSILVYTDLELAERLLRAIYRSHNIYCIHLDKKSPIEMRRALEAITACFDNVFLATTSHMVTWGEIGQVYAELQCMKDLLRHKNWKYLINLTGQEFPLKTNLQIVRTLKTYNWTNDIETNYTDAVTKSGWYLEKPWYVRLFHKRQKTPVPHGMTLARGSAFKLMTRQYVDFTVHSKVAADLLQWVIENGVMLPDELYFQTLNGNAQLAVPGAMARANATKPMARFYFFVYDNEPYCGGHVIRYVCNFGYKDLPQVMKAPHLFANKFRLDYEPITYRCMEKELEKKEMKL